MSNRSRVIALLSMFALAAGCTSTTAGTGTTEDAGAATPKVDSGAGAKKDGAATTENDAGEETTLDSGKKKDAAAVADTGGIDGGDPDSSSADAGSASDGSSGTDSGSTDAAVTCGPQTPVGFAPTWKAPNALHVNTCTTTQVDTFADCIFYTNITQATCDAYAANAANAACKGCLFSDEAAGTYGPLISSFNGDLMSLNVAGCIARTSNDVTANGCGAKVQAANQCAKAACVGTCPVVNDDYLICTDDAVTVCASYETAATCATALQQADASAAACDLNLGFDFFDNAKRYGRLFCMP